MALIKCPECDKEISDTAKVCPSCGYKQKKLDIAKHKKISTNILIIGVLLFVAAILWSMDTSDQDLAMRAGYYFLVMLQVLLTGETIRYVVQYEKSLEI